MWNTFRHVYPRMMHLIVHLSVLCWRRSLNGDASVFQLSLLLILNLVQLSWSDVARETGEVR